MGGESWHEVSPLRQRIAAFGRANPFYKRVSIIVFGVVTARGRVTTLCYAAAGVLGKSKATVVHVKQGSQQNERARRNQRSCSTPTHRKPT